MGPIGLRDSPFGPIAVPLCSRTEAVVSSLRNAIVEGRLKAGQKLNLDDLARQFGVSRMPVRDALKLLESEGLVRIFPHRGVEVSTLDRDDIEELFGLRQVLEQTAASRAIDRLETTHLATMKTLLREMDSLGDNDDSWLDLNTRFHAVLNEASGWPRLVKMIGVLRVNVERYVRVYVTQLGRARPQAQHWALYEACLARDADAARTVIAEHLNDTAAALLRTLPRPESTPPSPSDPERPAS
jgi:DNA-binding GntR family transcriptional regulator